MSHKSTAIFVSIDNPPHRETHVASRREILAFTLNVVAVSGFDTMIVIIT